MHDLHLRPRQRMALRSARSSDAELSHIAGLHMLLQFLEGLPLLLLLCLPNHQSPAQFCLQISILNSWRVSSIIAPGVRLISLSVRMIHICKTLHLDREEFNPLGCWSQAAFRHGTAPKAPN